MEAAQEYLQVRQAELSREYRLSEYERYDRFLDTGRLIFSNGGVPGVEAAVLFVGSVSLRTGTWLWSWANRSFAEESRSRLREVRAYGERQGLMKLACSYWQANEVDGWQMTAIAAQLLGARGAYRSPEENGFTFMVIMDAWRVSEK